MRGRVKRYFEPESPNEGASYDRPESSNEGARLE